MPAGLSEQAETSSGLGKEQGAAANLLVGLQAKLGQKGERERRKVCLFGKIRKQMKFKFKFEFHQTNSMQQHVCNKHKATNLIW
jgi:hypothetical protein